MMDSGLDEDAALAELDLLGVHTFYTLSHELHRRKTFWIDESLAFMLANTRLDVRGEGLRLPFPSFALMFTDRETLAIAEELANRDRDSNIRGLAVRSLTVYVTQIPAARGTLGIQLSLLLDANTGGWPWILTRDLDVGPDDVLDEIIESRFPDVQNLDPVFAAPELRQRSSDGGVLFARFMVRGHWRRAPETWRDRNPRWIEPPWKGPELGAIVEREYRMKP